MTDVFLFAVCPTKDGGGGAKHFFCFFVDGPQCTILHIQLVMKKKDDATQLVDYSWYSKRWAAGSFIGSNPDIRHSKGVANTFWPPKKYLKVIDGGK
jgi:hypothetical protein